MRTKSHSSQMCLHHPLTKECGITFMQGHSQSHVTRVGKGPFGYKSSWRLGSCHKKGLRRRAVIRGHKRWMALEIRDFQEGCPSFFETLGGTVLRTHSNGPYIQNVCSGDCPPLPSKPRVHPV